MRQRHADRSGEPAGVSTLAFDEGQKVHCFSLCKVLTVAPV
jgi:hypothetical protein